MPKQQSFTFRKCVITLENIDCVSWSSKKRSRKYPQAIQPSRPGPSRVQMSARRNREKKSEEIPVRLVPPTIIAQRSPTSRSRMHTHSHTFASMCVQWHVRCHANVFPTHNANFLPGERLARPELFTGRDRNWPLVIGSESRAIWLPHDAFYRILACLR